MHRKNIRILVQQCERLHPSCLKEEEAGSRVGHRVLV